jgi:2-polyprenyl-3-methyl-5-hydroxy-6-metoxy-1,4-benzoquinol methylase
MAPGPSDERRERIEALGYDYAAQPTTALDACNLCGATVFVGLTHRDRYGYPASAHACARCGLVFLNPQMTASAYGRFYDGVYRPLVSAFHGRLIDAMTIQDEQRVYAAERAAFMAPFLSLSAHRTMLDIGGSTGIVAAHLVKVFGVSGTLIDPAPLEVEQARRLGLETITGLVEQHDFGDRRFDLVIICQTVDHLLDVTGVLARVRQLLTPTGRLFIDIVDFRAAYLRNWSVEDATKIDHPYYLTQETMEAYLARTGFDVLRADYAADHLHVSYMCAPGTARPNALPDPAGVAAALREVRFVQNAPRPR